MAQRYAGVDLRIKILNRMRELDEKLKDNPYHDGWYSKQDVSRFESVHNETRARYYLEALYKEGRLERDIANKGHGYYWWYIYRLPVAATTEDAQP